MRAIQRVKKILKNINPLIRNYVIGLMIAKGRKNCAAMSHSTGIPDKYFYEFFDQAKNIVPEIENLLKEFCAKALPGTEKRALAADPTHIIKPYAQYIGKLCYDRAGTTKRPERCLVPIYAMIIDKFATIPLGLRFWMQKKLTGNRWYKSKAKLIIELITQTRKSGVQFDFVPLDGGCAVPEMFDFFAESEEQFVMRMTKSRKITTTDGICAQIQNHPALKLHRNEREKKVKATYQGRTYFFVAYKRRGTAGDYETVYLISNMDLTAKQLVEAYDMRWPLEKVIRTTKQKFGAMQCQAIEAEKQHAHILAGFLTYAILDIAIIDSYILNVDEFVNLIRDLYNDDLLALIENPYNKPASKSNDPIVKPASKLPYIKRQHTDSAVNLHA